jgi:hypothetical protein
MLLWDGHILNGWDDECRRCNGWGGNEGLCRNLLHDGRLIGRQLVDCCAINSVGIVDDAVVGA